MCVGGVCATVRIAKHTFTHRATGSNCKCNWSPQFHSHSNAVSPIPLAAHNIPARQMSHIAAAHHLFPSSTNEPADMTVLQHYGHATGHTTCSTADSAARLAKCRHHDTSETSVIISQLTLRNVPDDRNACKRV